MSPIQILQEKIGVSPDNNFGPKSFEAFCKLYKMQPIHAAHFLGQCDHETGGFKSFSEDLSRYTADRLKVVFPKYYKDPLLAIKHQKNAETIANHVYGNRMGNRNPGDGFLFLGRGPLMLTGRENYTLFSISKKDPTILSNPSQVSGKYAFDSALFFFISNKIFQLIDSDVDKSILAVSKAVNIGSPFSKLIPHGLQDRISKTKKYISYIK